MTTEERAALRRFLDETPVRPADGRAPAMAWAALKFAATLLLVTGVGIAVGDGNEFDGVDCGVAAKPPGYAKESSGRRSRDEGPRDKSGKEGLEPLLSADGTLMGGSEPLVCGEGPSGRPPSGTGVIMTAEVVKMLGGIREEIAAVRAERVELVRENGDLRKLYEDGFFKFALRVDAEDFRAFAAIMALGNRKAAAEVLGVPLRTFYDRVRKWNRRGAEYHRMAQLIGWRKRTGRRIKVRLEDSVQSGEPNDEAENPVTAGAVLESITSADAQDYPAILRQVMETLEAQNPGNWAKVRQELVEMIKEEVPQ